MNDTNFNAVFQKTGMSLKEFGEYFKIPYRTVQDWKNERSRCPEYLLDLMEYKLQKENMILVEQKHKVVELLEDALNGNEFKFRINFLIGGLMCEDSNDTKEKIIKNVQWLSEISEYCQTYQGDTEKEEYMKYINRIIQDFLPTLEKELLKY